MQNYPPNILVDAVPFIAPYRRHDAYRHRAVEFAGGCPPDHSRPWPVDALLTMAAERLGTTDIATLDRTDFANYRTRAGRAFVNCF